VRAFCPSAKSESTAPHNQTVKFLVKMQELISVDIIGISASEEAAKHADVVALATNALDRFFPASWIRAGMHINRVRPSEMMLDALLRCHLIAVSTREAPQFFTYQGRRAPFRNLARETTLAQS
jgi:alkanesulfonate monooxygenase SsuD/methylene tetrahydromethanopterin reductase-like flavin-dependent oxidoreductase (luciferase family)